MLRKIILPIISLIFPILSYAGDMGQDTRRYFVSVSAGPSWTNPGSAQNIELQSDITNTYVPNNLTNTNVLANGELFLSLQQSFTPKIKGQLGLAFYFSNAATLNGFILEDGDPNFQNFAYQYKINHEHIALKTKWIVDNNYQINPYLSGGIGLGFNRSYSYSATPLIVQEVPTAPFQPHTQVAFSYQLGAGVQRALNQHLLLGLGYQWVSWGNSYLNPAVGQTSNKGLTLSNLYTQGIEFNISYLI